MSDSQRKPRYILRPVVTPVADTQASESADQKPEATADPFLRPAQEDDDGYDPFSDRPPTPEPTFQEDPWRLRARCPRTAAPSPRSFRSTR